MSCGNRFSCGIKRFQQHQFTPDRPSNPELHKENESRLSELLRLREEQDKSLSFSSPISTVSTSYTTTVSQSSSYYPWVQKTTN